VKVGPDGVSVVSAALQTDDGITPLFVACWRGHREVAGLLLDRGAVVDPIKVCIMCVCVCGGGGCGDWLVVLRWRYRAGDSVWCGVCVRWACTRLSLGRAVDVSGGGE
jgi:hypothetical protein